MKKGFDIEINFDKLEKLNREIYFEAKLSQSIIEKYVNDRYRAKLLYQALFKAVRQAIKKDLKIGLKATNEILFYAMRHADYFPEKFQMNLRKVLESGQWFIIFYEYSFMFRFLVYCGLPTDDLFEFMVFWENLGKESKKDFLIYFLFEIWKDLKKTENLIEYLIRKHRSLKGRQGR